MEREARDEALRRLRSIEGHIRGIERMLEQDCTCVELIRQTLAVRRALDKVSQLLVASHLHRCLAGDARDDLLAERQRTIHELLEALDLSAGL